MRILLLLIVAISVALAGGKKSGAGGTHVRGYTKKDGTYVTPHERKRPNKTETDNYSTKGNVNPYTGERGKKNPKK